MEQNENYKDVYKSLKELLSGIGISDNWVKGTVGFYNNGKTQTFDLKSDSIDEIKKAAKEFAENVNAHHKTDLKKVNDTHTTIVANCDTCEKKDVCDLISSEYQYDKNKFADDTYTDIKDESVNDLYIEKTEDSKTNIYPTTTLKQTFYLISEIYNNSPLFEVHVIDLIDNFAQYIDICRPKYKSAIINIEDKSRGNLILAKKDTVPIIFESSYLGTFNESTLYSINEFYKYGREIYLYNPITLRFYCISSGDNDESGLPELDIEKYGFKKASKVEESLLFEYSKTKW